MPHKIASILGRLNLAQILSGSQKDRKEKVLDYRKLKQLIKLTKFKANNIMKLTFGCL